MSDQEQKEKLTELEDIMVRLADVKDYLGDPAALKELGDIIRKKPLPSAIERDAALQEFFREWCAQCPILHHFTIPNSDLEDVAGALCPDEEVHNCPILLQLRDVRAIKPPEGWTPENNEEFIRSKSESRRLAIQKGE